MTAAAMLKSSARRLRETAWFRTIALSLSRNRYRIGGPLDHGLRRITGWGIYTRDDRRRSVDDLVEAFFELSALTGVDLFIEAGAKDATASRRAISDLGCDAIAFEANPYTHRRFAAAVTRAGVRYEHLALSDANGPVTFLVRKSEDGDPMADGQGSLLRRPDHTPGYLDVTIDGVTLDSYVSASALRSAQAIAMWIDVEGALRQVFDGAHHVLMRTDVLLVEVESRRTWDQQELLDTDVERLLARFGLRPVGADIQSRHQCNVLYVRDRVLGNPYVADRIDALRRPERSSGR